MKFLTSILIERTILWVAGRVLPSAFTLRSHGRNMLTAIAFAVVGGVILGALFIVGLYGLYLLMLGYEIKPYIAAFTISSIAAILAALAFYISKRYIDQLTYLKGDLELKGDLVDELRYVRNKALDIGLAFLKGLEQAGADTKKKEDKEEVVQVVELEKTKNSKRNKVSKI